MESTFVGIDISKKKLDVVLLPDQRIEQYPYDDRGIRKLLRKLKQNRPALIVMEATGGLEIKLAIGLLGTP